MKITPLDIDQQRFTKSIRGYDCREVDAFLEVVKAGLENMIRESNRLREENRKSSNELEDHRDRERALKDALIMAQKVGDEIKSAADQEAKAVIEESEARAEKIIDAAHRRSIRVTDEILEMRRIRAHLESAIRGTITTFLNMLDRMTEESKQTEELEQKVAFLPRTRSAE